MRKLVYIVIGLFLCLAQGASALVWQTSPDGNVSGTPDTTLTLGASDVGKGEFDSQSSGIFGVAASLGSGYKKHIVSASYDLYSWDSYNASNGYYDVFVMALTEGAPYWDLAISHPVQADSNLIWPSGGITAWGGDDWGDGVLDNTNGFVYGEFTVDPTKEYFLNIILDVQEEMWPSWGFVRQGSVQSIPEPSVFLLVGAGLVCIGILKKRISLSR